MQSKGCVALLHKKMTLHSNTPTVAELTKAPASRKKREGPPDAVEFVDGASDVPLIKVPFLPALPGNAQVP